MKLFEALFLIKSLGSQIGTTDFKVNTAHRNLPQLRKLEAPKTAYLLAATKLREDSELEQMRHFVLQRIEREAYDPLPIHPKYKSLVRCEVYPFRGTPRVIHFSLIELDDLGQELGWAKA